MSFFHLPAVNAVQLHLPKTGGLSLRNTKKHHAGHGRDFTPGIWSAGASTVVHDPTHIPKDWPMGRCFTFVRHPIDRFVSAWKYCLPNLSAEEFLKYVKQRQDPKGNTACHHAMPQMHPFYHYNLAAWSGRFELYASEISRLCRWLAVPDISDKLPRVNTTKRRRWEDEVESKLIPEVVAFYEADFRLLGYEKP